MRQLHAFTLEALAVDFPFARSVIVVRSEVTIKKTGETTTDTRYYLSSAERDEHSPEQWQGLVRGHWGGVEIRNHWRRDAIWGEDGSRTRNATALGQPGAPAQRVACAPAGKFWRDALEGNPRRPPLETRRLPARYPLTVTSKRKTMPPRSHLRVVGQERIGWR